MMVARMLPEGDSVMRALRFALYAIAGGAAILAGWAIVAAVLGI